jgi:hypothetical protein
MLRANGYTPEYPEKETTMTNRYANQYPCPDCYIEPVDNPDKMCTVCEKKLADTLRKLDKALSDLDRY